MTNIFKKGIAKNENKSIFMGAFVPPEINTYITLYAIANNTTKNKIIEDCLGRFIEPGTSLNLETLPTLIAKVANKAVEVYKLEASRKKFSKTSFYSKLRNELFKKKIEDVTVDLIIKRVENETK